MILKEKFQQEPVVVYMESFVLTNQSAEWCEQIAEEFAIGFAEWSVARAMGVDSFKLNDNELEIYKKEKGL